MQGSICRRMNHRRKYTDRYWNSGFACLCSRWRARLIVVPPIDNFTGPCITLQKLLLWKEIPYISWIDWAHPICSNEVIMSFLPQKDITHFCIIHLQMWTLQWKIFSPRREQSDDYFVLCLVLILWLRFHQCSRKSVQDRIFCPQRPFHHWSPPCYLEARKLNSEVGIRHQKEGVDRFYYLIFLVVGIGIMF